MTIVYSGEGVKDTSGNLLVGVQNGAVSGAVVTGGRRNLIINGAMQVAQRGTSFSMTNSLIWPVDRFQSYLDGIVGSAAATISQSSTAPAGFNNSIKVDITGAETSPGVNFRSHITYRVEGFDIRPLSWGTSDAVDATLSFWVRSHKTGTFCTGVYSTAGNVYMTEYTINSADTWERKTVTIPGDTAGTWATDNSIGLYVSFPLAGGTGRANGVADTWYNTGYYGTPNQSNLFDSTDNDFYITGVQLEVGSVATPFEHRSYGEELALCQRYYEKSYSQGVTPGTSFGYNENPVQMSGPLYNYHSISCMFAVEKRASPTIVSYGHAGTSGKVSGDAGGTFAEVNAEALRKNTRGLMIRQSGGTNYYGVTYAWTADSEL
jgi:hypothetical protein